MFDLLCELRVHPMIWSPLAGGRLFTGQDDACRRARGALQTLAQKYGAAPSEIVYAWLAHHPCGALPICGSNRIDRLEEAVRGVDLALEHADWYAVYTASGQKILR